MIISEEIQVKIHSKNIIFYKNSGFSNISIGDFIKIDTSQLPIGSHFLVKVECDICKKEKRLKYFKYISNIKRGGYYTCSQRCGNDKRKTSNNLLYGVDSPLQNKEIFDKVSNTNIKKYGVVNTFQSEFFKNKIYKSNFLKYGCKSPSQNKDVILKMLKTKKKNGYIENIESNSNFISYKKIVRKLTNKNIKTLYENWNGFDYYDGDYIKDNFSLDSNDPSYTTIDHKISVLFGFINNIDPNCIADINNLCVTKRKINSVKNYKTEDEFKRLS